MHIFNRILKEDLSERLKVEQDPTQPSTSNSSAEQYVSYNLSVLKFWLIILRVWFDILKPIHIEGKRNAHSLNFSNIQNWIKFYRRPSEENDYEAADRFTGTLQEDFDYKTYDEK